MSKPLPLPSGAVARITSILKRPVRARLWSEQHQDSGRIERKIADARIALASGILPEDAIWFGLSDLPEDEAGLMITAAQLLEKWFPSS